MQAKIFSELAPNKLLDYRTAATPVDLGSGLTPSGRQSCSFG